MSIPTWWVRHGQSTWNAAGLMQGREASPPLTDLGVRQARATAHRLAGCGATRLLTSTAVRARQTADELALGLTLEPEAEELLVERGLAESAESVRERLVHVLRSITGPTILVTHGDVIVAAAGLLAGREIGVPDNGAVHRWDHPGALLV